MTMTNHVEMPRTLARNKSRVPPPPPNLEPREPDPPLGDFSSRLIERPITGGCR